MEVGFIDGGCAEYFVGFRARVYVRKFINFVLSSLQRYGYVGFSWEELFILVSAGFSVKA